MKSFGGNSASRRKPTNHVAFFNVHSYDCKSICESYEPCIGIDIQYEKGKPASGCFIHSRAENLVTREQTGPAIYIFHQLVRLCSNQTGDDYIDMNWASNGTPTRQYSKGQPSYSILPNFTYQCSESAMPTLKGCVAVIERNWLDV